MPALQDKEFMEQLHTDILAEDMQQAYGATPDFFVPENKNQPGRFVRTAGRNPKRQGIIQWFESQFGIQQGMALVQNLGFLEQENAGIEAQEENALLGQKENELLEQADGNLIDRVYAKEREILQESRSNESETRDISGAAVDALLISMGIHSNELQNYDEFDNWRDGEGGVTKSINRILEEQTRLKQSSMEDSFWAVLGMYIHTTRRENEGEENLARLLTQDLLGGMVTAMDPTAMEQSEDGGPKSLEKTMANFYAFKGASWQAGGIESSGQAESKNQKSQDDFSGGGKNSGKDSQMDQNPDEVPSEVDFSAEKDLLLSMTREVEQNFITLLRQYNLRT